MIPTGPTSYSLIRLQGAIFIDDISTILGTLLVQGGRIKVNQLLIQNQNALILLGLCNLRIPLNWWWRFVDALLTGEVIAFPVR